MIGAAIFGTPELTWGVGKREYPSHPLLGSFLTRVYQVEYSLEVSPSVTYGSIALSACLESSHGLFLNNAVLGVPVDVDVHHLNAVTRIAVRVSSMVGNIPPSMDARL